MDGDTTPENHSLVKKDVSLLQLETTMDTARKLELAGGKRLAGKVEIAPQCFGECVCPVGAPREKYFFEFGSRPIRNWIQH